MLLLFPQWRKTGGLQPCPPCPPSPASRLLLLRFDSITVTRCSWLDLPFVFLLSHLSADKSAVAGAGRRPVEDQQQLSGRPRALAEHLMTTTMTIAMAMTMIGSFRDGSIAQFRARRRGDDHGFMNTRDIFSFQPTGIHVRGGLGYDPFPPPAQKNKRAGPREMVLCPPPLPLRPPFTRQGG